VQGLLHVPEMGWARVSDPAAVVKVGDEVTVKVLRIEADGQKIALGLKQLTADPWTTAADAYTPGQLVSGRVTRVADFGVFVELEPGVEGLVPASETGLARYVDLKRHFPAGTMLDVVVGEVNPSARRISLSVSGVQRMREAAEVREYSERASAEPGGNFGSLADKLKDALKPRQR
jgi:ribosomal protein S1